jgi:membrane-associated phospholipid phosphatase
MFVGQPAFLHPLWEHACILRLQMINLSALGAAFSVFAARYCIFLLVAWVLWQERTTKDKAVRHGMREAGWAGAFSLLLALGLSEVIQRNRPFLTFADVQILIPMPLSQYSFPSAHASLAFGIAFACLWGANRRSTIVIPMVLAALVGLGRILVGVHYPTDVLAGMVVGGLSFALVRTMHHVVRHLPKRV